MVLTSNIRPHLGASTVEAQENVSKDVCGEVVKILRGMMPKSAVNAPIIMPEEYRTLQPFVRLVERMGDLYTQHFAGGRGAVGSMAGGRRFELILHGELASVTNTRPLLAALVKGLTSSVSDSGGRDVNMVNAGLIAKEKGIAISETRAAETKDLAYASLVTLRAGHEGDGGEQQVIEGYVSGQAAYISRLDRFAGSFAPEGTMLLLHNYDEPGKIGAVGLILASHRVNINFMQVAGVDGGSGSGNEKTARRTKGTNEALMILGVDGEVTDEVLDELVATDGILNVNVVRL